jgi:DeoR/GlpR family transcriptional regulator of sugar metabolism
MGHDAGEDITSALREHGPATGPELASRLGLHPATVERRCLELQQSNRIRLVTGGRYAITDESPVQPRTAAD